VYHLGVSLIPVTNFTDTEADDNGVQST
jgi:hypothetical protein